MKTKILFIVLCNLIICNLLIAQNITNTLGTDGVFSLKDNTATYLTLNQVNGYLTLNRSLVLPYTTGSTLGVIYKGNDRFIHTYHTTESIGYNTFLGIKSGNFTLLEQARFNTGVGYYTLAGLTTGYGNTTLGAGTLQINSTGFYNTAVGFTSLNTNTTGKNNTALGFNSLNSNVSGNYNTALGTESLYSNINGNNNVALGVTSLYTNTSGRDNTAVGLGSSYSNTTGNENTAVGNVSLYYNTTGSTNAALGSYSLFYNNTGSNNTAVGHNSLYNNNNNYNNAFGMSSLYHNVTGANNSAIGYFSMYDNLIGFNNTAVGNNSLLNNNGNYNTALGYNAGSTITTGYNLTCLGIDAAPTSPTAVDQVTLGNIFVTSLRCNVQTITSLSDARDKKNIKDLSLGLDFITKLHPRQFNWDKREWYDDNVSDGSKMKDAPTAGFIAQELDSAQTTAGAEWLNLVLKDNPDKWEATYGNLLPVMVKAIQELKTENDLLKDKLAKFEEMQSVLAGEIEKMRSNNSSLKEVKLTEK